MEVLTTKLYEIFTKQMLDVGGTKLSIAEIGSLVVLIVIAFFVSKIFSELIRRSVLHRLRVNRGLQEAITVFIRYLLLIVSSAIIRLVGKQKKSIEATSHLFLHFNPLVNTKAISSIS